LSLKLNEITVKSDINPCSTCTEMFHVVGTVTRKFSDVNRANLLFQKWQLSVEISSVSMMSVVCMHALASEDRKSSALTRLELSRYMCTQEYIYLRSLRYLLAVCDDGYYVMALIRGSGWSCARAVQIRPWKSAHRRSRKN